MKTVKLGNEGEAVALLQELLARNGYKVTKTKVFDQETKNAVVELQKKHGLDADGVVGYRSWEALLLSDYQAGDRLTDKDFEIVVRLLDCETAALKAVQEVETGGKGGFFAPGKPAILFEGHIFWGQLKKKGLNPQNYLEGNENILYPKWEKGHYKGGMAEYDRLEQARKIDRDAANASASWGMFQIMGFNYAACDESSVESFVNAMSESEFKQLILSARFIKKAGMLPSLQTRNWREFARRYNGPAYAENLYDEKLTQAYRKHSK